MFVCFLFYTIIYVENLKESLKKKKSKTVKQVKNSKESKKKKVKQKILKLLDEFIKFSVSNRQKSNLCLHTRKEQ